MATAIPAIAGLGGSIIGGISGKKAAKKEDKRYQEQMAMMKPLIEAQTKGSQFALDQSKPYLQGAAQGVNDLQNFWSPLMKGDRSAIDQFLSPERRAINQGFQSTQQNLSRMAPRGGGRISALAGADVARQGQMSDLIFGGRQKAAGANFDLAQLLGSLGTSTLSAGLSGGQQGMNLLNMQNNRSMQTNTQAADALGGIGNSLGGFLATIFGNKGSKGSGGSFNFKPMGQGDTGAGNPF